MIEKRSGTARFSEIGIEALSADFAERQIQRGAIRRKSRLAVLAAMGSVVDLYGSRRVSAVKKRRRSFSDDSQNIARSFQAAISKAGVSFLADSNRDVQ